MHIQCSNDCPNPPTSNRIIAVSALGNESRARIEGVDELFEVKYVVFGGGDEGVDFKRRRQRVAVSGCSMPIPLRRKLQSRFGKAVKNSLTNWNDEPAALAD